jgi:hypothetical protein
MPPFAPMKPWEAALFSLWIPFSPVNLLAPLVGVVGL